jgi:excisionase family DNA binding protein
MKSTNPTNSSDLHYELQSGALGETYIKSFSQRTGEQAGKLIADFLDGILFLFLVNRSPGSVRSPAVPPRSKLSPAVPPKSENLMTAYEIAIFLNISKAKAYQLLQRGEIPAVQFGRSTRVRRQDLDEFIRGHVK